MLRANILPGTLSIGDGTGNLPLMRRLEAASLPTSES
jgi:hypothetical protein